MIGSMSEEEKQSPATKENSAPNSTKSSLTQDEKSRLITKQVRENLDRAGEEARKKQELADKPLASPKVQ